MARPRSALALRLPADRRLRRVLAAYALSLLIEFSTWLAVLLVGYELGGPVMIGAASLAMLLPAIVLVPFVAAVGDRLPRGRALSLAYVAVGLSAALAAVLLVVDAPFWLVLIPAAVLSVSVSLVRTMHYAALPLLSHRPADLVSANALSSSLEGLSIFVGFVSAGLLTDGLGAWAVMAIAGLLGLTGAILTRGLGLPAAQVSDGDGVAEIRAAFEGFLVIRRSWGALAILLLIASLAVVEGANETLNVTFNDEVLGLGPSAAGLLAGSYGIGIALAGIAQSVVSHRRVLAPTVLAGALLLAAAEAAVPVLGALLPAALMLAIAGFGASLVSVSARTLLQRSTDNAVLARVLAIQEGIYLVGLALGALVGPLLVTLVGPRWGFVPLAAAIALMAAVSYRAIRTLDTFATFREREAALLREVEFLQVLAPQELEYLAHGAAWSYVPAGSAVITQGELGEQFYVVSTGELSVAVDGALRDHTLGPGDGFGEIALLRGGRRTATVTALTDCELLVLGAERFLAAVTSSVDGLALATGASQARLDADRAR